MTTPHSGRDLADLLGRQITERLMTSLDPAVLRANTTPLPKGTPMTERDLFAGMTAKPTEQTRPEHAKTIEGNAAARIRAEARADVLDDQLAEARLDRDALVDRLLERERDHTADRLADQVTIANLEQRRDTLTAECEGLADALAEANDERVRADGEVTARQRRIDAQVHTIGEMLRAAGLDITDDETAAMSAQNAVSAVFMLKQRADQLDSANASLRAAIKAGAPVAYQTVTPSGTREHTEQAPVDPMRRAHDQIAKVVD